MTTQTIIRVFSSTQVLSEFAAGLFEQIDREAVRARGRFLVSLSGGSTPLLLYRLLAQSPYQESLDWKNMYVFWGDERCVPFNNPESSYFQTQHAWFSKVSVPAENIIRVRVELGAIPAAQDYARQLAEYADDGLAWPRFDFCLLGMGADGHTASLFPGSALTVGLATVAVTANYQDRPANRVSLTPDVFNAARNVVFLATGAEKSGALRNTLMGQPDPVRMPAQRIQPADGKVWWLVDEAAASQLPEVLEGVDLLR